MRLSRIEDFMRLCIFVTFEEVEEAITKDKIVVLQWFFNVGNVVIHLGAQYMFTDVSTF